MKTAFKLDAHPRRPRPLLSEPPAGYFDALPTRIMARLPQADARATTFSRSWFGFWPAALRTGLASLTLLGGFAASFYLSGTAQLVPRTAPAAALDAVPRTELVGYLLNSGARVETTDLAVLAAAHPGIAKGFLHVSADEVAEALDAQPADDSSYL